jgi:hypothetical protein
VQTAAVRRPHRHRQKCVRARQDDERALQGPLPAYLRQFLSTDQCQPNTGKLKKQTNKRNQQNNNNNNKSTTWDMILWSERCVGVPKVAGLSLSKSTFHSGLPLTEFTTVRGSSTIAPIVVNCLLCYPSNTLWAG